MDKDEAKLRKDLARLQHCYSLEYEMVKATAAFEHAALRPLFILNGGALGIYLALYGTLASRIPATMSLAIGKLAVFFWIAGLFLAWVAAYLGARSQFAFRKLRGREAEEVELELEMREGSPEDFEKAKGEFSNEAQGYRKAAIVAGAASLVLFILGVWRAVVSIG